MTLTRCDKTAENRGFSLVELALVMSIIAVIAAVATPRYVTTLTRYRADAAARRLVSDLTLARATAERRSGTAAIEFPSGGKGYHAVGVVDPLGIAGAGYVIDLSAEPYAARIESLRLTDGSSRIEFDGYGMPSTGGEIVVESGGTRRVVRIDTGSGRASTP